ncbi:MAG: dihydrodipicolinate synthase family protein [Candidatus Brocadiia bacterium]|nr:MAG: dihydrodipicolinate synthase family protein [Candidatus Brocadiia bacterium]
MSKLPVPLRGIIPPMVTPLTAYDTLDVAGVEKLVEHILGGGVHGLFILGTTGNAPALSYRLRFELIERVCKQVGKRVPVLVGITDSAFAESINVANKAAQCGAAGLVLAHPFYLPAAQDQIHGYLERLVPKLQLPVFLYNMPSCTKLTFDPGWVRKAADIDGIAGLKDSSANMVYFHKLQTLLRDKPDFALLVGPEELLGETVLLGGHGGVCGGANIFPKLYVDLYNAAVAKDIDKVNNLHNKVMDISCALYSVGIYGSSYLQGVMAAVSCLGICSDFMAEPFVAFGPKEKKVIDERLVELGIKKK